MPNFRHILVLFLVCADSANAAPPPEVSTPFEAISSALPQFRWRPESQLTVDINADGQRDWAFFGTTETTGAVGVVVGGEGPISKRTRYLDFMLSNSHQRGICGRFQELRLSPQDAEAKFEGLSARPEGWKGCAKCFEIEVVTDVECDPLHVYWNHDRQSLGWWRN